MRGAIVFDNLIQRGEMPVTIGVFVDPGQPANRNIEYDAFNDAYATFLLTEILPSVRERYADDPEQWAIAGGSSGGSCAFTIVGDVGTTRTTAARSLPDALRWLWGSAPTS